MLAPEPAMLLMSPRRQPYRGNETGRESRLHQRWRTRLPLHEGVILRVPNCVGISERLPHDAGPRALDAPCVSASGSADDARFFFFFFFFFSAVLGLARASSTASAGGGGGDGPSDGEGGKSEPLVGRHALVVWPLPAGPRREVGLGPQTGHGARARRSFQASETRRPSPPQIAGSGTPARALLSDVGCGRVAVHVHRDRRRLLVLRVLCEQGRASTSDGLLARLFPPQASDDDATVEAPACLDRDAFRHVLSFWQRLPPPGSPPASRRRRYRKSPRRLLNKINFKPATAADPPSGRPARARPR